MRASNSSVNARTRASSLDARVVRLVRPLGGLDLAIARQGHGQAIGDAARDQDVGRRERRSRVRQENQRPGKPPIETDRHAEEGLKTHAREPSVAAAP